MPAIVALTIRSIIQMAVTLGLIELAQRLILPLVNRAVQEVIKIFGVSEEDAKDIIANEWLLFAESVGVGVLALRSKMPTKIAEYMGFTSKGWGKRPLSSKAATAKMGTTKSGLLVPENLIIPPAAEIPTIITAAKSALPGFKIAFDILWKGLTATFLGFIAFNNLVDFGNWNSGAYQKTFQKIFAKITGGLLVPDEDYRKTKTASPDVFDKVYNTYKIEGAVGINDPFKKQSVLFSRDNLIDLIDVVGAELLRTTQRAATKDVLLATQLFIVFKDSAAAPALAAVKAPAVAIPRVKVFTGVLTQGKLGEAEPFAPRESDLISSMEELTGSAQSNLAGFLTSLPGKIVYEIKIVSSVTTKDGFIQRGTARQIITGYTAAGAPKYKTIVNKFAVINIYVFTERRVRTKVQTVVLGPVDSIAFQPKAADLQTAEENIKESIVTSDVAEIETIITDKEIEIKPVELPAPVAPPGTAPLPQPKSGEGRQAYIRSLFDAGFEVAVFEGSIPDLGRMDTPPIIPGFFPLRPGFQPAGPQATLPDAAIPASNNPNRCLTTTIAEFFDVDKRSYPSVAERSKLYEAFGFGPAGWYTGTYDQNAKLLKELKIRSGC